VPLENEKPNPTPINQVRSEGSERLGDFPRYATLPAVHDGRNGRSNGHRTASSKDRRPSLEKRYVWRIASALKWGFADLESVSIEVDRQTLSPEDLRRLAELLRLRPAQFCIFLKTLFGAEAMERLMLDGIEAARREE
jgi:hypothetical protein